MHVYIIAGTGNLLPSNNHLRLSSSPGRVKLCDFGLAKHLPDGKTFTMCGVPDYFAPEIIDGKVLVACRTRPGNVMSDLQFRVDSTTYLYIYMHAVFS